MGTRSIILITGHKLSDNLPHTTRFYKHFDGYPEVVIPTLEKIIKKYQKDCGVLLDSKTLSDYIKKEDYNNMKKNTGLQYYASGLPTFEKSYNKELILRHFDFQGDLEYVYVLDTDMKNISVYSSQARTLYRGRETYHGEPICHIINPFTYSDIMNTIDSKITSAKEDKDETMLNCLSDDKKNLIKSFKGFKKLGFTYDLATYNFEPIAKKYYDLFLNKLPLEVKPQDFIEIYKQNNFFKKQIGMTVKELITDHFGLEFLNKVVSVYERDVINKNIKSKNPSKTLAVKI